MKSAIFVFITFFSCAYDWRTVTAQSGECDINSCYGGLSGAWHINQDLLCNIVESTAAACLDGLNLNQSCFNVRDWAKAEFPYMCSLPREYVSTSFQCFFTISQRSGGNLCEAALEAFSRNTVDPSDWVCGYYATILDCYRDAMMNACPDHVKPYLHYFTSQLNYTSMDDCPVFQQLDPYTDTPEGVRDVTSAGGSDNGAVALSSTSYWIKTAMVVIYIWTWFYAE